MNKLLTKQITDHSDTGSFSFSFFCDCCGKEWKSPSVPFETGGMTIEHEEARLLLWTKEHNTAYEQANLEALLHFNNCPICGKWVCDDCISLEDQRGEMCKDCNKQ